VKTDGRLGSIGSNPVFPQARLRLESGWIPIARVSLFAGYDYPVFNQFHEWESDGNAYFDRTNPYGGMNLHLIGDIGITGRYENNRWVAGVFFANIVLGYDGKGLYFSMLLW
jgi:hypothetical protein